MAAWPWALFFRGAGRAGRNVLGGTAPRGVQGCMWVLHLGGVHGAGAYQIQVPLDHAASVGWHRGMQGTGRDWCILHPCVGAVCVPVPQPRLCSQCHWASPGLCTFTTGLPIVLIPASSSFLRANPCPCIAECHAPAFTLEEPRTLCAGCHIKRLYYSAGSAQFVLSEGAESPSLDIPG